jgi:hypothetical protein
MVEIEPGSTQLVLDAQTLGELVPDKFTQVDMFHPFDPGATCLDVFADALDDTLGSRSCRDWITRAPPPKLLCIAAALWLRREQTTQLGLCLGVVAQFEQGQ